MSEFWYDYIINDLENMEYRLEDFILKIFEGSITASWIAFVWKLKKIKCRFRKFFRR